MITTFELDILVNKAVSDAKDGICLPPNGDEIEYDVYNYGVPFTNTTKVEIAPPFAALVHTDQGKFPIRIGQDDTAEGVYLKVYVPYFTFGEYTVVRSLKEI